MTVITADILAVITALSSHGRTLGNTLSRTPLRNDDAGGDGEKGASRRTLPAIANLRYRPMTTTTTMTKRNRRRRRWTASGEKQSSSSSSFWREIQICFADGNDAGRGSAPWTDADDAVPVMPRRREWRSSSSLLLLKRL